jgi:hypothetical protein
MKPNTITAYKTPITASPITLVVIAGMVKNGDRSLP